MNKKILLIGIIVVLLLTIPIAVYLASTRTSSTIKANASAILTFNPPTGALAVGQKFKLDVSLDPGQNQISFVKLIISYNSKILKRDDPGFTKISDNVYSNQFPVTLEGPTYDVCSGDNCTMSVAFSIGSNITQAIKGKGQPLTIASVNFIAINSTDTNQTTVGFATGTQILSLATGDQPSENVLNNANPIQLTITGPSSPTPTSTSDNGATSTPVPNGGTGSQTTVAPQPLSCTSLTVDQTTSPTAPLTSQFTLIGASTNSTIAKATFNFGDGSVQDVTTGGGIGTANLNTQLAHVYQTTGVFTATATLTDGNGNISNPTSCSKTISIGQTSSTGGNGSGTTSVNPTTTSAVTAVGKPGPGDTIVTVGVLGAAITVLGGLIVFGL